MVGGRGCGVLTEGLRSANAKPLVLPEQERFLHVVCRLAILTTRGRCKSNESVLAGCGVTVRPMARDEFHRRRNTLVAVWVTIDGVSLINPTQYMTSQTGQYKSKYSSWQTAITVLCSHWLDIDRSNLHVHIACCASELQWYV